MGGWVKNKVPSSPSRYFFLNSPQLQRLARKMKFHLLQLASLDVILSKKEITKALMRLRGWPGWSAPFVAHKPMKTDFLSSRPVCNNVISFKKIKKIWKYTF